jgi:hypothetical protein
MSQQIQCSNCGGMMNPQWDGRVYVCPYCKTQAQVGISADQIAAGFALDLANVDHFLSHLANTLSQGFKEHARIDANGSYVMGIEINLEPNVFLVKREGQHAVAQHRKVVRGIALRTSTLALDRWLELLLESLAEHANTNARAGWVLGQIGGKGK